MIDDLLVLPSHLRERLATALETGVLPLPPPPAALQAVLGFRRDLDRIGVVLGVFAEWGLNGPAAAAWLRAAAKVESRMPKPDLVWSGPEVPGLFARDTRQVYDQLLGAATHSLWVSTYAFFDGPKAFDVLARRMDDLPDIEVVLLLNIQRKRGDTSTREDLVRRFATRFWSVDWPGARRPRVYYDPRALEPDGPGGVLHAKAVVADGEALFMTSANLTEAALDRNIELGMLVRDRALAHTVIGYFQGLIDRDRLLLLPGH